MNNKLTMHDVLVTAIKLQKISGNNKNSKSYMRVSDFLFREFEKRNQSGHITDKRVALCLRRWLKKLTKND